MACATTPMVEVFPRARPRAAALGLKSNLTMAASTACLRPSLTLTVPLMMRDTVLADTPASRATIFNVADWRGFGPLLMGRAGFGIALRAIAAHDSSAG